jgi:hypothetical protein
MEVMQWLMVCWKRWGAGGMGTKGSRARLWCTLTHAIVEGQCRWLDEGFVFQAIWERGEVFSASRLTGSHIPFQR